jgi:Zn finger protein HypA/HybF involved in hydrogenase expression
VTTAEFSCPSCRQVIEVNDEMRETILRAGCPVCTADVTDDDFGAP